MDTNNIMLVKIGKHINIHTKDMKKIVLNYDLITPFGIEESNNLYYCNWIINGNTLNELFQVETVMEKYMREKYDIDLSWKWKSSIRRNNRFKNLLRTTVKSEYDYESDGYYNLDIIPNCIWIHRTTKTFGIQFTV